MEIEYRRFSANDFLGITRLSDDEWAPTHASIANSMIHTTGDIEQCFVAISQSKVIGYIYGFVLPNGTLLPEFLYVLPAYRKQGVGAALLSKLEKESSCTASKIFYHRSLHHYYEKQGYSTGGNLEVAMKDIPTAQE